MAAASVLTNIGRGLITAALVAATTAKYGSWGIGSGTAAASDTALITESSEARVIGTLTQHTISATNDTYQNVFTMTASASRSITEIGTFDATTAGNMMVHATFASPYALSTGDQMTFTVQTQFQ